MPVKAGTKYAWRYETVAQVMDNPLRPDISWLKVQKGKLVEHFVGATLDAEQQAVCVRVGRQPLKVNSTPLTVRGLNPNWTAGYYEPQAKLYRPLGVAANGMAYAQVDAARSDVEVVLGNVVTCDRPELRILVTQDTDADGKATGTWRVDLFNPTDKAFEANLAVDPAFSLIQTRAVKAAVPVRGQTTLDVK
jgi:hypothetical protein